MHLYLFNPGHDLALANGSATFCPPQAVRQMEYDLSLLPLWYADEGSVVLSENKDAYRFVEVVQSLLPSFASRNIHAITPDLLREGTPDISKVVPWGWDRSVAAYLRRQSLSASVVPSDDLFDQLRRLSHRQRAVEMLPRLVLNSYYTGKSFYFTDLLSCLQYAKTHDTCVFKAPLSGSGKGLNWYRDGVFSSPFERWCLRQISTQGGVVAEPMYSKCQDLAMEIFIDDDGLAHFAGYSFFETSKTGVYDYNLLVPPDFESEKDYMKRIDTELLPIILTQIQNVYGMYYRGYMGVDMMICNDGDELRIHPCVEINARMTMGIFARLFFDRYINNKVRGEFHVEYCKHEGEALAFDKQMKQTHPLQVNQGKIIGGYLSLVPITQHTHAYAYIQITSSLYV